MHGYDFDEMARHFNAMRVAYLDYRRGGHQPSVEKKLEKYLALSDLFFRKFPNPFSDQDDEFIAPSKEYPARSNFKELNKKLIQFRQLKTDIEERIDLLSNKKEHKDMRARLESYLIKCEDKITATKKEIDLIESSRLPA